MNNFETEYQKLNPEQKLAVDFIEGPVMVVAGAGTGKTQTIALRIANILEKTQVNPSNILCLTFTESAATNMRNRLSSLIGSDASGVRISTFHGFCNSVIKDYPEFFLFSKKESVAIDDIKQIQIIRSLIDNLPSNSSLKNLNSLYFFQKDIIRSIQSLKKENITPQNFNDLINLAKDFVKIALPCVEELNQIRATKKAESEIIPIVEKISDNPNIDILYCTRLNIFLDSYKNEVFSLSDLKKNVKDLIEKTASQIKKQEELLVLYSGYQKELISQNFFDFEDMILWVLEAFKNNKNLLADYQEKFQYILVDEFQDTNSSQMGILDLLVRDQESPNIFVVGDDDQSIFRFQGASIENIYDFYKKYNPKVIVLKNNYRSHRLILDSSNSVIKYNQNRITNYIENLDKSLISVKNFDPDPINLFVANSDIEENHFVAEKIKSLIGSGTKPSEIAVLFRANKDIDGLIPFLSRLKIRFLVSDTVNILENIFIQELIDLFRYLDNPLDDVLLGKILSFKFLKIKSLDLYKLYRFSKKENQNLSDLILDEKKIGEIKISQKSRNKISKFVADIARCQKDKTNLSLSDFFNIVIRKFNYLPYLLKHRDLNLLKQLSVLYSQLKSTEKSEKIDLSSWAKGIDILIENEISLNSLPLIDDIDNSIRLMTVHKAKGLEFEHVFLMKVLSGKWDNSFNRSNIKLPLGILKTDISGIISDKDVEEDRRLFYVALTRAKNQIYISYPKFNEAGKEQLPSIFINEIDPNLIEKNNSNLESESQSLIEFFNPKNTKLISLDLESYLKNYLADSYYFNITHLNSYLKCPLCFFFKTILRLPQSKTRSLSLGTSIHGALAYLFNVYKKENKLISLDKFLFVFEKNLEREQLSENDFQDLLVNGRQILTDYYLNYQSEFNPNCLTEHDFKLYGAKIENIRLTGKIDKIEILDECHSERSRGISYINVVDFKTGKPDSSYDKLKPDGDYFRQLVFYKILCEQSKGFKYKVKSGTIDFIQKDYYGKFKKVNFQITDDDVKNLKHLIIETYKKITALEFAPNPKCDDPEHLHYLFEKYFKK